MITGSMPALVTPFLNGEIDKKALAELVEWQIEQGSNAIVPVGTTGESPTLTHAEHREVIKIVVDVVAGRIPVMAGAGSNNTAEAKGYVEYAGEVGADAALVVTPYYNKPTQAGMIAHFTTLADIAKVPIYIYNIPPRSVVDMTPETMGQLAKHPMIVGVKDATADLSRVSAQRITCGKDFIQLSGEDPTALGHIAQGGVGCVSVTANVAPALCSQLQALAAEGKFSEALAIQDRLMPLHHAIFAEPGVSGAKAALSMLDRVQNEVRSPLLPVSDETYSRIEIAMDLAGLI